MEIIKNAKVPPVKGYTDMAKRMELGDCIEVACTVEAQGLQVALRRLGYTPVRRKIYRIWKTEGPE